MDRAFARKIRELLTEAFVLLPYKSTIQNQNALTTSTHVEKTISLHASFQGKAFPPSRSSLPSEDSPSQKCSVPIPFRW